MNIKWDVKFQLSAEKWVFIPSNNSRVLGINIKQFLSKKWKAPNYYWHLQKQGHIGALTSHLNDLYFYKFDLKNFFSQINKSKITRAISPIVGYKIARTIASESTVKNPNYNGSIDNNEFILPYGFIQSPIIASITLYHSILGRYIDNLIETHNISVYMDDIIVSSTQPISSEIIEKINWYSHLAKLPIQDNKTQGPSGKITVFNIELSHQTLTVISDRLNKFKEIYLKTNSQNVKLGILNYLLTVNNSLYKKLSHLAPY